MAKVKRNPKISEATRRARRKYNAKSGPKKRRAELNKINRKKGTYGNGDGLDNSHTCKGKGHTVKEPAAKNRRRNGRNGKSKYKKK